MFFELNPLPMKRIIICESGATKSDWRVIENGIQKETDLSAGMNVSTMRPTSSKALSRKQLKDCRMENMMPSISILQESLLP